MDLVNEYTIGGTAYFNVYIQRKLPRRLWYKFSKEIKRRGKTISHTPDQMQELHTYDGVFLDVADRQRMIETEQLRMTEPDFQHSFIANEEEKGKLQAIYDYMFDSSFLNDEEREFLIRHICNKETMIQISLEYDITTSAVSKIINGGIKKIQMALQDRTDI